MLRWLESTFFSATDSPSEEFYVEVFRGACDGDHLSIAQWAADAAGWQGLEKYRSFEVPLLNTPCERGDCKFVRFLVERFRLGKEEILGEAAIIAALANNKIAVADFLLTVSTFSKTEVLGENLRLIDEHHASEIELNTLRWICTRLGVTKEDIPDDFFLQPGPQ